MRILIDQREKQPWTFKEIFRQYPESNIQTKTARLLTGDYTLEGYEDRIAIERKSPRDIFMTLQQGFSRFDCEFARMDKMESAWIVVEAPLARYAGGNGADYYQMLSCVHKKNHVFRGMMNLMIRYPGIKWKFCQSPEEAEWFAFLQLLNFYNAAKR